MEQNPFNPETHRKDYEHTEAELSEVKESITGDKSNTELAELIAKRDALTADLEAQKAKAYDQADEDNENLTDASDQIEKLTAEIEQYKDQIAEITGVTEEERGKSKAVEDAGTSLEEIKSRFAPFLTEAFTQWYDKETAEKVEQKLSLLKPEDIDWEALKKDIDKTKFGEYSLNPETQGLNFESFPPEKIKVFDFKEFVGKPRAELAKHLALNYADKYHIPGIEYWKYVIKNPNKAPAVLKDGNYHYFFGSTLRLRDGNATVPDAIWDGDRLFERNALWLGNDWSSNNRVVLLEK